MSLDPAINFGKVTLSAGYASGITTVVLSTGDGAKLPDPATAGAFNLVWWNSTDYSDPADDPNREIVRCTARTTDTLTIIRAQESTSDNNHNTGGKTYKMILSITKKTIDDITSTFIAKTIGTAKGDLIGFSASGTPVRIPVGQNFQVPMVNTMESTDFTFSDPQCLFTRVTQNSHGFTAGQILKFSGGVYALAKGDSSTNAEIVGMVFQVVDTNTFLLLIVGFMMGLTGLTANTMYFLDHSTAGTLTATPSNTNGQINKPCLYATSTTSGFFSFCFTGQEVGSSLHASTHQSGGSDAIKLDDLATPDDNTDLNASTSKHGLLKKLDNDPTHFMDGQGNWSTPPLYFMWNEITGTSQSMAPGNGYIANNAGLVTLTLPSVATVGMIVEVCGKGTGGWKIAQNASGVIHFGTSNTTTGTGGYLASIAQYDTIRLICTVANNEWAVLSSQGNITVV